MPKKLLTLFCAVVIALAVIAIKAKSTENSLVFGKPAATNAAFRDGAYLGKLDARQGRDPHLSVGRWSRDKDRIAYTAGYEQSYDGATQELAQK